MRIAVLVVCAGCRSIFGLEEPTRAVDESDAMEAPDDGAVDAMQFGPWSTPTRVFPADNVAHDDPTLTDDMRTIYIDRASDIYRATRNDVTAAWSGALPVPELNSGDTESTPEVSGDGGEMYFTTTRTPTMGNGDIWYAVRASNTNTFGPAQAVPNVNSSANEGAGGRSADGQEMVFASNRDGTLDLFYSRLGMDGMWTVPVPIEALNTAVSDDSAWLSRDGQTLYFASRRDGNEDLFFSRRNGDVWMPPEPMTGLNTTADEADPWLSPDGRTIYFARGMADTKTVYMATRSML